MVMILGYSILGVAIGGIVSTEMSGADSQTDPFEIKCLECDAKGHAYEPGDAMFVGQNYLFPGGFNATLILPELHQLRCRRPSA